ncbi:D-sedoheptulose 7-phosphate isomerase [Vulcanococcus sp.]|jgi:D-sedoheptulose 7-phosphate isomerase|uniref:D-sedoheptulose 7-phosphate isomerase n=1 Tax=Vulcanococcus sp. TaxID=2856995 RepID=UPI0037D9E655
MPASVSQSFEDAARTYAALAADSHLHTTLEAVVELVVRALGQGNKLLFAGNGGSAADCQHMAGEFVSRFMFDRNPLPAVALTTDSSILTAIGNDYGYEQVFSRQVRGIARVGDVLFAYSTSGNSQNIVAALQVARELQVATVGLTGASEGRMNPHCDHLLQVPSTCVPRIQEGHLLMGHTICEMVEERIFSP